MISKIVKKVAIVVLICLSILGCSKNQPVVQTEIVYRPIPEALLSTCTVVEPTITPEAIRSYKEAFYVVSEAYLATNQSVALCNTKTLEAIKYNNRLRDNKQQD